MQNYNEHFYFTLTSVDSDGDSWVGEFYRNKDDEWVTATIAGYSPENWKTLTFRPEESHSDIRHSLELLFPASEYEIHGAFFSEDGALNAFDDFTSGSYNGLSSMNGQGENDNDTESELLDIDADVVPEKWDAQNDLDVQGGRHVIGYQDNLEYE